MAGRACLTGCECRVQAYRKSRVRARAGDNGPRRPRRPAARRRFDFLKMEAYYDGSLVGPSGATLPSYGSTGLEIMCVTPESARSESFPLSQPAFPIPVNLPTLSPLSPRHSI